MAFRLPLGRFASVRAFHATPRSLIRVGDQIPKSTSLYEKTPSNKVCLANEFKKSDGYIIGVPGAFTSTCSGEHIPSYINSPKLKDAGKVFVVAVNDPFVMKAWADNLDPKGQSGIRFIADPTATFIKDLKMGFDDAAPLLGGTRSRRFVLKVEFSGIVTNMFEEGDPTVATVTLAENVLE